MNYAETLDNLRASGNFRTIPANGVDGQLDFSTNDYLGLGRRYDLQREFMLEAAGKQIALTASASRLLASDQHEFSRLEAALESRYGRPALLFNSGYHANTGMVSALADSHTLIAADKLVHASIIDGIRLSGAPMLRWRHNDYSHLQRIIEKEAHAYERVIIIAESVYSMDGDTADLKQLIDIKRSCRNAMLYIDEAHALGVCGTGGLGLCRAMNAEDYAEVDVIIGTFGKACASTGAFAAMSPTLKDIAINRSRSFIFSTAIPPICCAWSTHVLGMLDKMDGERAHLESLGRQLADGLKSLGLGSGTPSHIQPVVIGDAHRAVSIAAKMLEEGVKVLPIRTPTVPAGTERLRISLSAANTTADITRLINALRTAL